MKDDPKPPSNENPQPSMTMGNLWLMWFIILILTYYIFTVHNARGPELIPYSEFKQDLKDDKIAKLTLNGKMVLGQYRSEDSKPAEDEEKIYDFKVYLPSYDDPTLVTLLNQNKIEIMVEPEGDPLWVKVILGIIPWILLFLFFMYINRMVRERPK